MNALLFSTFLAAQCPGGVCPVPQRAVVYAPASPYSSQMAYAFAPTVPRGTVGFRVLPNAPVRRFVGRAPLRTFILRRILP
jgi:hypothetical protein